MSADQNSNVAPFPGDLADVVSKASYRPGWTFALEHIDRGQGSEGLTLIVTSKGYDTYRPELGEFYRVHHYMPVPPAAYNRASWEEWLLDCLLKIEAHETCEFLVVDGRRPFAPVHAPGHDPYTVRRVSRVEDVETTFRGERREGSQV